MLNVAEAMNNAMVHVTLKIDPSELVYTLKGKPDAVRAKIDGLRRQYPPAGYGPHQIRMTDSGAVVTINRSCD